ncbi:MAG: DUF1592 domain-containing protein [Planctomycetes bacterium]|nr:DUF1592 domain-containing protein [Planctomycetota bacterium]
MSPRVHSLRVAAVQIAALLASTVASTAQQPEHATLPELIEQHCADCHNADDRDGDFDVEALFAGAAKPDDPRVELAVQRLRSLTMPPPSADTMPDTAARRALVQAFADRAAPTPGSRVATVRRLTRLQYRRVVHDLLGVDFAEVHDLPDDVPAHGFDGIGDVAGITPARFEAYLGAAAKIAARVVVEPALRDRAFPPDVPLSTSLPQLLERAFRRPPQPAEVAERLGMLADLSTLSDDGQRTALLQSVLLSPSFLLRAEHGRVDDPARLDAFELAGRLSFALTSSAPDATLLEAARDGALLVPDRLVAEARRLLREVGGRRLADDFAAQWLRLREVLTMAADFRRYPQIWNHRLRPAMYEEVALLFAAIVDDDLPVTTLLDADFTYVDATLAKLYGLPAPGTDAAGDGFVRVALPDRRRGGLLGTGAMLMLSSYPLRTSPVRRGQWILDKLLDASTPPPPPTAGSLPKDDEPVKGRSLREQLERHRKDRSCASCHAVLDPLGFALERYDVLGGWREQLHGQPIDATGALPDGAALDGPIALKDELLRRRDDFVRALAARLLTFAVGRPMQAADEPELQRIVERSAAGGHFFSALLEALLRSPLFTMRDPDLLPDGATQR